jgi:hypothetical protein
MRKKDADKIRATTVDDMSLMSSTDNGVYTTMLGYARPPADTSDVMYKKYFTELFRAEIEYYILYPISESDASTYHITDC